MAHDARSDWDQQACKRELARLRIGMVVIAIAGIGTALWLTFRTPRIPPVIAVERLEIVEADGTPAFIFANSERPAAATIDGQVLMAGQEDERKGVPSIIFFDGKGDEVGGMLTGVHETPEGYTAVRHFSLDGYKQDQTLVLSYVQDSGGSSSGLYVNDRPLDVSILQAQSRLGLPPSPTRAQLQAAIEALPEETRESQLRDMFGVPRLFLGSTRDRKASLVLRDGQGRPRILIEVPDAGEPSIQVLNEQGATILRLPG